MKIKEEKWNDFINLFELRKKEDSKYSSDENFYYYEEKGNTFGINKKNHTLSLVSNNNMNIEYYVDLLGIEDYIIND